MHWQLDVGFREDACRVRVDDQAEAFKGGITRKRMKCAMDTEYLSKVRVRS